MQRQLRTILATTRLKRVVNMRPPWVVPHCCLEVRAMTPILLGYDFLLPP